MIGMIAIWTAKLLGPKLAPKFARPLAWFGLVVAAMLIFWAAKAAYDASVIDDALDKANIEALERKDEAIGEADLKSGDRRKEHDERVKTTGELVDEAISKGCAVGEYLASNGANCVQ